MSEPANTETPEEVQSEYPAFRGMFKACLLGFLIVDLTTLLPDINIWEPYWALGLAGLIVWVWLIVKLFQTLLAKFTCQEFASGTVLWNVIVAAVVAAFASVLVMIGLSIPFAWILGDDTIGFDRHGTLGSILLFLVSIPLEGYIGARLFHGSKFIPLQRSLGSFWRPFYTHWDQKQTTDQPEAPAETQAESND